MQSSSVPHASSQSSLFRANIHANMPTQAKVTQTTKQKKENKDIKGTCNDVALPSMTEPMVREARTPSEKHASKVTVEAEQMTNAAERIRKHGVIAHMFNYTIAEVMEELDAVEATGFNAIQLSPVQWTNENGEEWFMRYQPDGFGIGGPIGSKEELEKLVCEAGKRGIDIIADVVVNHQADGNLETLRYPTQRIRDKYGVGEQFGPKHFNPRYCIVDWDNPEHVQSGRLCDVNAELPDLNHDDPYVIDQIHNFLQELVDLGVSGFRVDAVKHFAPRHFRAMFDRFAGKTYTFGEVIGTKDKLDPYLGKDFSFMDFPLFFTMSEAFKHGGSFNLLHDPIAFGAALASSQSVRFTINHDIPYNDGFRPLIMEERDQWLADVFVFGLAGGVVQFFVDRHESFDGAPNTRWHDAHNREDLKAMIQFRKLMSDAPQMWCEHLTEQKDGQPKKLCRDNDMAFQRGNDGIVLVNKSEYEWKQQIKVKMDDGAFVDLLTPGKTYYVKDGVIEVDYHQRGASMLVRKSVLDAQERAKQAKEQIAA